VDFCPFQPKRPDGEHCRQRDKNQRETNGMVRRTLTNPPTVLPQRAPPALPQRTEGAPEPSGANFGSRASTEMLNPIVRKPREDLGLKERMMETGKSDDYADSDPRMVNAEKENRLARASLGRRPGS